MTSTIGQSVARLEDWRFLRGTGTYIGDIDVPGVLYAAVVRSDHAHARITSIDAQAALAVAGVVGVHTVHDLRADGVGNLPCVAAVASLVIPPRPALADEVVRHVGDPVAVVIADSQELARAAAAELEIGYEALPAVVGAAAALESGAPQLWPEVPGNLAFRYETGDRKGVHDAFAAATHVVQAQIQNHRVGAVPLEPRAGVGYYDSARDSYWLHCNAQGLHDLRAQLAGPIFDVPADQLHISAPDVGGGFGLKNFVYPEWVLLLWAAKRYGRPVRWEASRSEDFASATSGRDLNADVRIGLDCDGRLLAMQVTAVADMGAYLSGSAPNVSSKAMPTAMGGVYHLPALYLEVRGTVSNSAPTDAYRGAGKPEANFMIERMLDIAAAQCGFDPVELRRRNLFVPPYVSPTGTHIRNGAFGNNVDQLLQLADYAGFAARRDENQRNGLLRGVGMGCFLETSRGAPEEGAALRFLPDNTVEIAVGTESHGQGHHTALAQIAADRLGLPIEAFRYVQADTSQTRMGHGHGGARTMHMAGLALDLAVDEVTAKALPYAADLLQTDTTQVDFAAGQFVDSASGGSVGLMAVVAHAQRGTADANPLDSFAAHYDTAFTFPNGCHMAEVTVDPDTGQVCLLGYVVVDDYGTLVNPQLTAGQVHGGLAQGIGQALGELVYYDESGQLLSGSLMDYWLPRASEIPAFDVTFSGVPAEANRLGVKGSGQAGCIAAPQTVVNAVANAIGNPHVQMPLTSERVWRFLQN
jgi:aerobic carbon-monoxide dehydrogenase large subunit